MMDHAVKSPRDGQSGQATILSCLVSYLLLIVGGFFVSVHF